MEGAVRTDGHMKTIDEIKAAWNAQADRYNQWDDLGIDEIVHFAQKIALIDAAKRFDGSVAFSWVCADGYSNGFDVACELRFMAKDISNAQHNRPASAGPG